MTQSANQPIRWKERIGLIVVGRAAKKGEEIIFDFVLYPAVIAWLGTIKGGIVMTTISGLECLFLIFAYDWAKKDWLGYELAKEMRDGEDAEGWVARLVQKIARKSDWLAFIALSCYTDPFEITIYMRKGVEKYNGLSRRDWFIFFGSVLTCNLWWTVLMSSAVVGIRLALHWLKLRFLN